MCALVRCCFYFYHLRRGQYGVDRKVFELLSIRKILLVTVTEIIYVCFGYLSRVMDGQWITLTWKWNVLYESITLLVRKKETFFDSKMSNIHAKLRFTIQKKYGLLLTTSCVLYCILKWNQGRS